MSFRYLEDRSVQVAKRTWIHISSAQKWADLGSRIYISFSYPFF